MGIWYYVINERTKDYFIAVHGGSKWLMEKLYELQAHPASGWLPSDPFEIMCDCRGAAPMAGGRRVEICLGAFERHEPKCEVCGRRDKCSCSESESGSDSDGTAAEQSAKRACGVCLDAHENGGTCSEDD